MCGAEIPDALPEPWIEEAERRAGGAVPATLSEPDLGPGAGDDGARAVTIAVEEMLLS
jgi:hypothetical protein